MGDWRYNSSYLQRQCLDGQWSASPHSALSHGRYPLVPIELGVRGGAGWASESVWWLQRREKFNFPTGNRITVTLLISRNTLLIAGRVFSLVAPCEEKNTVKVYVLLHIAFNAFFGIAASRIQEIYPLSGKDKPVRLVENPAKPSGGLQCFLPESEINFHLSVSYFSFMYFV
jgi:hypothetical protein